MAMVDRYKKSGGFIQLLQVIETCAPKKREQFMKIINEETPKWGEAITSKIITYERILGWNTEALLEIVAQVTPLALSTSLKGLSEEQYNNFLNKLGPTDKRKIDQMCKESAPTPAEISACVMKIINETRQLFINGSLKYEKVDPELVIPDEIEALLEKSGLGSAIKSGSTELDLSVSSSNTGILLGNPNEIDSLRRKIVELNQIIMLLKKDNTTMKDKLDKIKKIA